MARKAAAMPQLVCMNCRRLRPSRLPLTSASSRIRRSTRFCVSLCGGGRYSPFDTIWVGIGVAAEAASAPATRRCSRSLSQLLIVVLPRSVCDQRSLDLSIAPNNVRMVGFGKTFARPFGRAIEARLPGVDSPTLRRDGDLALLHRIRAGAAALSLAVVLMELACA